MALKTSEDVFAAIRAVRHLNRPGRPLSDYFLRLVAELHAALVIEGKAPGWETAKLAEIDKSTASRWFTAARHRGFLG